MVTSNKYDISHLKQDEFQSSMGPIQDDEALLLYALVKVIRPKTVVEFGFAFGSSSLNFLKALDKDAKLYSYDIIEWNKNASAFTDSRFKFHLKSQTDFDLTDVDNRIIDFVFFDDGHIFSVNSKAFNIINDKIALNGILIVHDTGLHRHEYGDGCTCDAPKYCGGAHQKDERVFINWILDNHPEWQVIQIHSFNFWRHGLTIMQKKYKLGVDTVDNKNCMPTLQSETIENRKLRL